MKKKTFILTAFLCVGLYMAELYPQGQPFVQAKEEPAQQTEKQRRAWELVSHGNMAYWDGSEKAAVYGADFSFLWKKLSSISGEVYDPASYAHLYENGSLKSAEDYRGYGFTTAEFASVELTGVVEEETEILMPEELLENGEETEIPEPEETPEMAEDDIEISELEESQEVVEDENGISEQEEPSETVEAEEEQSPEVSVSGNDCPVEKEQINMEEETADEGEEG